MASTITARYHQTVERMAEGLRVHASLSRDWFGPAILFVGQTLSIASLFFGLWAMRDDRSMVWFLILPLGLNVFFAVGIYFVRTQSSRRVIARFVMKWMPEAARDIEWTFSDDRVEKRNKVSAASFAWSLVTKVVEVPTGFLIYQGKYAYDWVPGEAFGSPVDARLFARLAESHVKEYVLIGESRTDGAHD